jgi:CMP-N-acetylneuraminic acid synthetase
MVCFAFIFARGGSKGLPGKNIKNLNGKPLIQYTIEQALSSTKIDKIFVSTDDQEIASISRGLGVYVIKRPPELASDTSPEWLSWQHAIHWVSNKFGSFDYFLSLPATSPLRNVEDIHAAISKLKATKSDICLGITPSNHSPYFNMVKINNEGFLKLVAKPDNDINRRQDAPTIYNITTAIYATTPKFVCNSGSIFSGNVCSIEIPTERAVDIDNIYDFLLAEAILLRGLS